MTHDWPSGYRQEANVALAYAESVFIVAAVGAGLWFFVRWAMNEGRKDR